MIGYIEQKEKKLYEDIEIKMDFNGLRKNNMIAKYCSRSNRYDYE
jgi:hypothetical protein